MVALLSSVDCMDELNYVSRNHEMKGRGLLYIRLDYKEEECMTALTVDILECIEAETYMDLNVMAAAKNVEFQVSTTSASLFYTLQTFS